MLYNVVKTVCRSGHFIEYAYRLNEKSIYEIFSNIKLLLQISAIKI